MNVLNHYEHSASVEGYGVEADGNDGYTRVPTVQFEYPEDDEPERPVVRDQWRNESLLVKCQRRFAPVKSGDVMATPMLDKRLDVLQFALREAVEKMDVGAICKLADKARAATERLAPEKIAESSPGTRELHEDIVIHDDAERGKVVIQFPQPADQRTRRWVQMCGFFGSGHGATFWRKRTFLRGGNVALDRAHHCVERVLENRRKLEAAQQPAAEQAATSTSNPFTW